MSPSKHVRSQRLRCSRSLRYEGLELRALKAASPFALAGTAEPSSDESAAAEVGPAVVTAEPESATSHPLEAVLDKGTGLIGPLTEAEYLMLTGESADRTVVQSDEYGGEGYGGNAAPTTSGIADVTVDEDAQSQTIWLYDSFDDQEDPDEELVYTVVNNTNPDLVDASYGGYYGSGELVLTFLPNAYGTAEITVRATDTGDLWVETTFTVTVNPVNDAPVISDFIVVQDLGDSWILSGSVSDVDDDVEGMEVSFGGIFSSYGVSAIVQADGTFYLLDEFVGLGTGTATAQTQDDGGALSNLALYWV